MKNEAERQLFDAVQANPGDDAAREVYADWLEQHGDPRGAYLRLKLLSEKTAAELRQLERTLPTDWLKVVTRRKLLPSEWRIRSFDVTLSVSSAWMPFRYPTVALLAHAYGFIPIPGLDRLLGDDRGARAAFDGERSVKRALSPADLSAFFSRLDGFQRLTDNVLALEGVMDTSDVSHAVTLQGELDGVKFHCTASCACSGFHGADTRALTALVQLLLEGSQIDPGILAGPDR